MPTAMQQLINEIVEHLTYDDDLTEDSRIALETIRLRCLGKLEMEKQQMFDYIKKNYVNGEHSLKFHKEEFEQYYTSTYGSKGSDEHIVDTNEMISSQTEISDEEIEKQAEKYYSYDELRDGEFMGTIIASKIDAWVDAIKWYREQLKNK